MAQTSGDLNTCSAANIAALNRSEEATFKLADSADFTDRHNRGTVVILGLLYGFGAVLMAGPDAGE